ncbi:hypothetical protein Kisp01_72820 [Kineosporia sp. NBRC 101677]|nr:hypothetical protein Kisp01_42210 [Kineosporia sp. NBRC 101677]GLY20268.1 hypothetical protein Kisp01_72820 [Kineosporia sp. NBRC 101677]
MQVAGAILALGTDPATELPSESAFTTGFVVAGLVAGLSLLALRRTQKGKQA